MDIGTLIYKAEVLRSRCWPEFVGELLPADGHSSTAPAMIARCVCFLLTDALTTVDSCCELLKRPFPAYAIHVHI